MSENISNRSSIDAYHSPPNAKEYREKNSVNRYIQMQNYKELFKNFKSSNEILLRGDNANSNDTLLNKS